MNDDDNRLNYLIDFIKNRISYHPLDDTPYYKELLQLSIKNGNLYGQALAYIKYSRAYQNIRQDLYTENIKKAYEIAAQEKYQDILVRYYNLEGIRSMQSYDDANALSMYLNGMHIAIELSDNSLCAVFYNNIGEIFYKNRDYDKAILYYLKALNTMELGTDSDSGQDCKTIIRSLINSFYCKNDLTGVRKYLKKYQEIACNDGIHPFVQKEAEIKILMLEDEKEKTIKNSLLLFDEIKAFDTDGLSLYHEYLFLCDIFLEFKKKEEALFCLSKLEQLKMEIGQNYVIEIQKRKICYCRLYQIENDSVYKEFYDLTRKCEQNNTKAIANSLSAAVSLYETEKEKSIIKKERKDLEQAVMYDHLTGIYNRRKYNQIVIDSLHDRQVKEIAYIMIDIDYFKQYNDYYGHDKGDIILKSVSSLIQEILPEQAYLARYGGDEFSCLLVNKSKREIDHFMKCIQIKIKEKKMDHEKAGSGRYLTLSMGAYYVCKNKNLEIDVLIQNADDALYQVKNNGRNGYLIFYEDQIPFV